MRRQARFEHVATSHVVIRLLLILVLLFSKVVTLLAIRRKVIHECCLRLIWFRLLVRLRPYPQPGTKPIAAPARYARGQMNSVSVDDRASVIHLRIMLIQRYTEKRHQEPEPLKRQIPVSNTGAVINNPN